MLDSVRLQAELQPSETLEWTGRPNPRSIVTPIDWFLIPFSLVLSSCGLFAMAVAISSDSPLLEKFISLPTILIFLYMVFGRFLVSAWDLSHTWYGVTNQRIIILGTAFGHRVQSYSFSALPEIEPTISDSGRGTLVFGLRPPYNFYWAFGAGRRGRAPGFYDIPDARYVFDLINRHRRASS